MGQRRYYLQKIYPELINIDKKDWELWLFTLFILLLLTFLFIIYLMPNLFPFLTSQSDNNEELALYLGFFGILILLSSLYSLRKHLEIKRLRWELINKRIELERMSGRIKELGSLYEVIAGAG
ncbi:MAG: hypothetical protein HY999_06400, partial [Nitrospinae bacterium]|nr:hypothetical protein [Nitrospinota bacterium]